MFIYDVGYGTYEESENIQVMHEKRFTEKQFNKIIEDCLLAVLIKIGKPKSKFNHEREPSFQELLTKMSFKKNRKTGEGERYHYFMKELEKQGFREVQFEQKWSVFGWASAINPKDWMDKYSVGSEREKLARRLRRRLFKERPTYKDHLKIGENKNKVRLEKKRKRIEKMKKTSLPEKD